MIIIGGEPPFIEKPEPRFGDLLVKFNQLRYTIEEKTYSFNDNVKTKLETLDTDITAFINEVLVPTQAHLNARGAVHGETRASVGLSKKDNYRAATIAEQQSYAPVDAFVTPAGAKAALETNSASFVLDNYQQNDLFQFSSYYFPDEYPTVVPTRVEPVRYFGADPKVGVMFNADRLIFSPFSDGSVYNDQLAFISMPVGPTKRSQLMEISNLGLRYTNTGWNTTGAVMSDGTIAFFRPVVDKKIYQFRNGLTLGANGRNFILYRGYGGQLFKGLGVGCTNAAQTVDISHKFFQANQFSTNPILQDIVTSSYTALFDLMGKAQTTAPANGSHQISILDYITLPAGMTAAIGGNNNHGVILTLLWNSQDYELYLNICIPVTLTKGSVVSYITVNITEAIIPGTLSAGGSGSFRTLGTRVKDVIGDDFSLPASPNFCRVNDQFDFNNPVQLPGAVVGAGEVVKSMSNKFGVRVKRYQTTYPGLKEWLLDLKRPVVELKLPSTEVFTPARHICFTALPERVLPISHGNSLTQYLVYGLDSGSGKFKWFELTWPSDSILSTEASGQFGVRVPSVTAENANIGHMPQGLCLTANKSSAGTGISALVFTTQNGYRGKQSVQYVNRELTVGAEISLSFNSLLTLQAAGAGVLSRAQVANPAVQTISRAVQIQVYALTANKAVIVITDGVNYAEAAIATYSISAGTFILDFTATNGLKLSRVTPTGQTATGKYRQSMSGDEVWMPFSDMHAMMTTAGAYQIAVVRPFGELYGDISFAVSGITNAAPVFTVGRVNPARLYSRGYQFDMVDEVYPPLMIPNKGIYQTDPANTRFQNNMLEVMGTLKIDPFDINELGWVRMPAGGRVVIAGRTYVLDQDYAVKVNPTGTTYCYLIRQGDVLMALGTSVLREPNNSEILFGTAVNGVLRLNRQYIVMDNKVMTADKRFGSAIPAFINDGGDGPNNFFTQRDVVN